MSRRSSLRFWYTFESSEEKDTDRMRPTMMMDEITEEPP